MNNGKSRNIGSIIDWIRPSVDAVLIEMPDVEDQKLVDHFVGSNVRFSAEVYVMARIF